VIASRSSRALAGRAAAGLFLLLGACASSNAPPPPVGSAFEPLAARAPLVPDEADHAAHDLMAAVLSADPARTERTIATLESLDTDRRASGERPTGLVPFAYDLRNATLPSAESYKQASEKLLERDDLEPALRTRLEQTLSDDPLEQADERIHESHVITYGGVFNALAEPASHAATTGYRAAIGIARALVGLVVAWHNSEELTLQERQALVQWHRYLAENPTAPDAAELRERVRDAEAAWNRTQRDRALRAARSALKNDHPELALVAAGRALRFVPEDPDATALAREAGELVEQARADQFRSFAAPAALEPLDSDAAALARALLAPHGDVTGAAQRVLARGGEGPYADEAQYALAIAAGEHGDEDAMWRAMQTLASQDPLRSNMARHAAATTDDPEQNPYDAFAHARTRDRAHQVGWIFLGPLASGPRERDLPRPMEWLIELPSFFDAITSFPNRLVQYPWLSPWPFGREPAAYARSYLAHRPKGEHAEEVRDWLEGYEESRGNWVGALEVAEQGGAGDLATVREKAAAQALESAKKEHNRDFRSALLRRIAREFRDTDAGRDAGTLARKEAEEATPQRIRLSRGFLKENPQVRGPDGLGLRPELVDGDLRNGELHPNGVILAGGRVLEICYLDEKGDESAPPRIVRQQVSAERMARLVAILEETTRQNALSDPDDDVKPDAARDVFFERARLGLLDDPDSRAGASSAYAFLSMRERYGLVRGRESILPVDLVIQGSFPDIGLGAFPRIRMPKPTPDAVLYR